MALLTTMFESVLNGLYRPSISQDADMGTVQTFNIQPNTSGLPCSCQQSSVMVRVLYGQQGHLNPSTVWFAQDIGAQKNDQLQVTGRDGVLRKYNVLGPIQYVNRARIWSVDVELVSQPG